MMRVVILGQPGAAGALWSRRVALRLARRLELPCVVASDVMSETRRSAGWVSTATADDVSPAVLHAADTAIWLHYSPLAVARAWGRGLLARLRAARDGEAGGELPRLADIAASLLHMIRTPALYRRLHEADSAQLQVFYLSTPEETDFWLYAQDLRLSTELQAAIPKAA